MDSSLPVLVSRLPDRRALTRLVRAALRHEIASVELANGPPQRAEAHTLDLHVAGQPPLALLAEPTGPPQNGQFPLRLRPLYRAQAAQLYALLEAENVSINDPPPPDTSPVAPQKQDVVAPPQPGAQKTLQLDGDNVKANVGRPATAQMPAKGAATGPQPQAPQQPAGDSAPIARAMQGAPPPPVIVAPAPSPTPSPSPSPNSPSAKSASQSPSPTPAGVIPKAAPSPKPPLKNAPLPTTTQPIAPQKVIQIGPPPATPVAPRDPKLAAQVAPEGLGTRQGSQGSTQPFKRPPVVVTGGPNPPAQQPAAGHGSQPPQTPSKPPPAAEPPGGDPRRTAPSATWAPLVQRATQGQGQGQGSRPSHSQPPNPVHVIVRRDPPAPTDPRRTVPSATWGTEVREEIKVIEARAQAKPGTTTLQQPNAPPRQATGGSAPQQQGAQPTSQGAPQTPPLKPGQRRAEPLPSTAIASTQPLAPPPAHHVQHAPKVIIAPEALPSPSPSPIEEPDAESTDSGHHPAAADAGADAEDASLSVSVVFEPDDIPAAMAQMAAAREALVQAEQQPPQQQQQQPQPQPQPQQQGSRPLQALVQGRGGSVPSLQAPTTRQDPPKPIQQEESDDEGFPADVEEPSLSVSVVFEPDAIPTGLLANVPSPLGLDQPQPSRGPATPPTEAPASDAPATIADGGIGLQRGSGSHAAAAAVPSSGNRSGQNGPSSPPAPTTTTSSAPSSVEPGSGQTIAEVSPVSNESFFDDALANFPTADFDPDGPGGSGSSIQSAPQTIAEPYEVDVDEVELVSHTIDVDDDGLPQAVPLAPLDDDDPGSGLVQVPPPPSMLDEAEVAAKIRTSDPLDDDDSDNDATLIRLPTPGRAQPSKPPEPIVRPEARDKRELTPTQQTNVGQQKASVPAPPSSTTSGGGRRKKSTRRKAKEAAALERELQARKNKKSEQEASETARAPGQGENEDEDDETAALAKAPVARQEQVAAKAAAAAASAAADSANQRAARANDPALGRRIAEGKYVIESLIGSGAAGAVYRATHRELRRTVAIKLLHPHYQQDPHFMTSFRGEALAASQLDHPNVMRVLDFGQEADGLVYIVMEYLSGRTLQSLLDEERRLPTERAVEIMIQVCAALSVAHDHGIIHRDIKPDNIMLVPSRNDEGTSFELVKVCDFGIAALQNPRAEDAEELAANEHVIAGTPEYMSPEQARGVEIDARSDVYACGICLYELVTGRPPFLGDNAAEILIKQLEEVAKPPSQLIKGLDPIIEEVILRAIQKDPQKRHQSAREMRVELKELIDPGLGDSQDDEDELSIVENVPVLDDPASGFPGFFIAFSSAVLRFGRFERGHHEAATAMKELQKALKTALRGRSELTFARRDVGKQIGFCVMSGTAEIVDLRRLLGSQLMGSFGEPFIQELVNKGIAAMTLREGLPDIELHYIIEMLLGPFAHEDLRKELLSKPLRHLSVLFVSDVVGRDRKLSWKVGLCASRLARDLRALCNVRGISLKKMRETRDELIGGVARLLTRGDEVKQFIFNADLVDEAVANLRGFSSFNVAPIIVERVLHESCAETAMLLLNDFDAGGSGVDPEVVRAFLSLFAQRLVTERSPKSDHAVAELYRRKIITEDDMPRDLKEQIRAQTLADALVREPSQFLLTLDLIGDPETYASEMTTLEAAMGTLARRSEAVALLAVMSTLARHAKGAGKPGPRENAALRTMKSMIDKQRLLPIATTLLVGPAHQKEAARQLVVIAGSVGASALYAAREATNDPAARPIFVKVLRDTGPAGWTLLSQVLPRMEVRDDNELALVEDMLRAMPERQDQVLGEAVAKFLAHPALRATALQALVPLWGERARKPLVEALEYADEPTRILALNELRRLHAIDEYVFNVVERFLTMKGSAGEELRASAAAALSDVINPLRARAIQLLSKAVEGKRGFLASLRGGQQDDETVVVMEAMGRALLQLDRNEGIRAIKSRVSRSEGLMKARLQAVLQMA